MSAAHPWPEGVPELPEPLARHTYYFQWIRLAGYWRQISCLWGLENYHAPVVGTDLRSITHANSAARALGIIPQGESASGASPAGADGEGKDA